MIDTTGKGFSLTSADDGVMFDFFADNKPFKASWTAVASGNAFLALPVDGKVENAKELFGNITPQPPSDHPNGFLALAVYDDPVNGGNGDGVIDAHDEVYAKLRLWIDANHNGIAEPEELHMLPELGVNSISLRYTDSPRVDEYGNKFRYKGLINVDPADGTSKDGRTTYDVFFVSAANAAASCKSSRKTQHISSASEQDKMDYPWMADTSLPDKLSKVMFADFGQTVKVIQSSLMETGPGNLDGTGAGVAFRLKFSDDHKAVLVLYPNDGKKGMKELFEQPVMETIVFESGRWEAKNAGVSGRIAQYGK